MNEPGLRVRFMHRSGSAASAQQDRPRKSSLIIAAAREALARGKQDNTITSSGPKAQGQKHHVPGVDRKSPRELLGAKASDRKGKGYDTCTKYAVGCPKWAALTKRKGDIGLFNATAGSQGYEGQGE